MKIQDAGIRDQESGFGNQESGEGQVSHPASSILNPDSHILNPEQLQRIRWRCRRGLLELDIILERFIEAQYISLSLSEREIFEQFLDMADNPLWDMISGKMNAATNEQTVLLRKIRSA